MMKKINCVFRAKVSKYASMDNVVMNYGKEFLPQHPLDLKPNSENITESLTQTVRWRKQFIEVDRILQEAKTPFNRSVALSQFASNFDGRLSAVVGNLRLREMNGENAETLLGFIQAWYYIPEIYNESTPFERSHKALPNEETYQLLIVLLCQSGAMDAFQSLWKVAFEKFGFRDHVLYNFILRAFLVHKPEGFLEFFERHYHHKLLKTQNKPDMLKPNLMSMQLYMRYMAQTGLSGRGRKIYWNQIKEEFAREFEQDKANQISEFNNTAIFGLFVKDNMPEVYNSLHTYYNANDAFLKGHLPSLTDEMIMFPFQRWVIKRGQSLLEVKNSVEKFEKFFLDQGKSLTKQLGKIGYRKKYVQLGLQHLKSQEDSDPINFQEAKQKAMDWIENSGSQFPFPMSAYLRKSLFNRALQFKHPVVKKFENGELASYIGTRDQAFHQCSPTQQFYRIEIIQFIRSREERKLRNSTESGIENAVYRPLNDPVNVFEKIRLHFETIPEEQQQYYLSELIDLLWENDPFLCRQFIFQNYDLPINLFTELIFNLNQRFPHENSTIFQNFDCTLWKKKAFPPNLSVWSKVYSMTTFQTFEQKEIFYSLAAQSTKNVSTRAMHPSLLREKIEKSANGRIPIVLPVSVEFSEKTNYHESYNNYYKNEIDSLVHLIKLQNLKKERAENLKLIMIPDIAHKLNKRVFKPDSVIARNGKLYFKSSKAAMKEKERQKRIEAEVQIAKNWNKNPEPRDPELDTTRWIPFYDPLEFNGKDGESTELSIELFSPRSHKLQHSLYNPILRSQIYQSVVDELELISETGCLLDTLPVAHENNFVANMIERRIQTGDYDRAMKEEVPKPLFAGKKKKKFSKPKRERKKKSKKSDENQQRESDEDPDQKPSESEQNPESEDQL